MSTEIREIERGEVLHQVTTTPKDGAALAFQEFLVSGEEKPCYTFVWIKKDGKMSIMGRVRIPDVGMILELLTKAVAEGWLNLNDYKKKIKWCINISSMEEKTNEK